MHCCAPVVVSPVSACYYTHAIVGIFIIFRKPCYKTAKSNSVMFSSLTTQRAIASSLSRFWFTGSSSLAHPSLFYTGKIGLAHCHTLSCVALQPTVQPNQIAERLIRHLTPYMNQSDLQTVVHPVYFCA